MTMIDVDLRLAELRDDFLFLLLAPILHSFTLHRILPSCSIPKGYSIKSALRLTERRNPICKYFSHLSAEINDGRGKLVASLCRIHPDFATLYPGI